MRNETAIDPSRIRDKIEGLRHLTTAQLKDKYRGVFGEDSQSNHKQFLFRRVAWRIIEQLSQVDVDDVVTEAGAFRVSMRVPGGLTAHVVCMPSAKDVIEYRRGFARVLDLPYNRQELTINLGAGGALYQKLAQGTEGYAGAVPIIHQVVAVKAAIDALEAGFQEDGSQNS